MGKDNTNEHPLEEPVSVKISHGNEIRRVTLSSVSFSAIENTATLFGIDSSLMVVKYEDDDGDKISMSSDMEFREALRVAKSMQKVLRLFIELKAPPPAPVEEPTGQAPTNGRYGLPPSPFTPHRPPGFFSPHFGGPMHSPHHPHPPPPHHPHPPPHHPPPPHFSPYHQTPPHIPPVPPPSHVPVITPVAVPQPAPPVSPLLTVPIISSPSSTTTSTSSTQSNSNGTFSAINTQENSWIGGGGGGWGGDRRDPRWNHHRGGHGHSHGHGNFHRYNQPYFGPQSTLGSNYSTHSNSGSWSHHDPHAEKKLERKAFKESMRAMREQWKDMKKSGMTEEEKQKFKEMKYKMREEMKQSRSNMRDLKLSDKKQRFVARHVEDVTIPDGTELPPNTPFIKTWKIRNEGPAWPSNSQLLFVSNKGDNLNGPERVVIKGDVQPGQEVEVSVPLITPNEPGRYVGYYRMVTPDGVKFGQRVWVSFVVIRSASEANTSSPASNINNNNNNNNNNIFNNNNTNEVAKVCDNVEM